jgi:DNA processing protein
MVTPRREQAAVLALTKATEGEWYRTAALISEVGSALAIIERRLPLLPDDIVHHALELAERTGLEDVDRAEELIAQTARAGAALATVLDEDYPSNLQQIYNRPPFIFIRGAIEETDVRGVAVVGTRRASEEGIAQATALAHGLAEEQVTVVSGLAAGIDSAAHRAALEADGRTLGVIGNGILSPVYPRENASLATEIVKRGALVSQFWPEAPPTRYSFPMRNVVMSGIAVGTVVVEASATSGAKMQARLALEHGKRLFLVESLVMTQEWAQKYAQRPGVTVVRRAEDVLGVVASLTRPAEQMTFAL